MVGKNFPIFNTRGHAYRKKSTNWLSFIVPCGVLFLIPFQIIHFLLFCFIEVEFLFRLRFTERYDGEGGVEFIVSLIWKFLFYFFLLYYL